MSTGLGILMKQDDTLPIGAIKAEHVRFLHSFWVGGKNISLYAYEKETDLDLMSFDREVFEAAKHLGMSVCNWYIID